MEEEIEIIPKKLEGSNFTVVNFKHEDYTVDFKEPISSYSFWKAAEEQANRAMFQLKKENPQLSFNFSLQGMMLSEEEKKKRFMDHLTKKYPSVDLEKLFSILESSIKEIIPSGPDENHPNPFLKFEINSDFIKVFISSIIENYIKERLVV